MHRRLAFAATLLAIAVFTLELTAQTPAPPPAPALVQPPSGAALAQPFTLRWSAVSDPDGPIGSYTWQIGTTTQVSGIRYQAASLDLRHLRRCCMQKCARGNGAHKKHQYFARFCMQSMTVSSRMRRATH